MHALLDLVEVTASADTLEVGRVRARDAAELVEDVTLLQRAAAGLATIVVFDLASPSPPWTGEELRARRKFLRAWLMGQRLEATWMVDS